MQTFKFIRYNSFTGEKKAFSKQFPDAHTAKYQALSNHLMANAWHIVSCIDENGTEHCK